MTDEALAKLAQDGDHDAFEELVHRYKARLYSFLVYRSNRSAAEDVFQEVCVKLWTHINDFDATGNFSTWAFTIARRTAIDFGEKELRRSGLPLDESVERVSDGAPGPERAALASEFGGRLGHALAALSAEQREVFLMREYGGLSFKEIAAEQGCPLNTALARMRYAVQRLRGIVEGHA